MFCRQLLTRLDHVKPTARKSAEEPTPSVKTENKGTTVNFSVGDEVIVRNSVEWTTAVVNKKLGYMTYLCQVEENLRIWKTRKPDNT